MRRYRRAQTAHEERITTPLLIMHGDIDFVPTQQARRYFTALFRLDKPARFVRYWGEGHVVDSPANVRHIRLPPGATSAPVSVWFRLTDGAIVSMLEWIGLRGATGTPRLQSQVRVLGS